MLVLWGSNQSSGPAPVSYWITSTSDANDFVYSSTVCIDSSGNSYSFGSYNIAGLITALIEKYNVNGVVQWQKGATTTSPPSLSQNAVFYTGFIDYSGNIYVAGVDQIENPVNSFVRNGLLAKYNSSGVLQWQRELTDPFFSTFTGYLGLYVDSSGNIYLTGETDLPSSGDWGDILIAKYNSSGVFQFANSLSDPASSSYNIGFAITVDSSGNYYVVGYTSAPTGDAYNDGYIAKFNSSNVLQWQKGYNYNPAARQDQVNFESAVLDSSGNIYCCGESANDFTSFNLGIVAKFDSSGTIVWQRNLSDSVSGMGLKSIAIDSSGNLYVAGIYYNSSTNGDAIITKYNSSGVLQWQRSITSSLSSPSNMRINSIKVDSSGNYYISGTDYYGLQNALTMKFPTDGSRTGTYGYYTYAASSFVDSAAGLNSYSGPLSYGTPSLTAITGNLTVTTPDPTLSTTVTIV